MTRLHTTHGADTGADAADHDAADVEFANREADEFLNQPFVDTVERFEMVLQSLDYRPEIKALMLAHARERLQEAA